MYSIKLIHNMIMQCVHFGCFSPLHWAAEHGHYELAEMLINRGADVDGKGWRVGACS
jgi:hypothetical protein